MDAKAAQEDAPLHRKTGDQKDFGRLILFLHIHSDLYAMNIRIPIHTVHQVIHSRRP